MSKQAVHEATTGGISSATAVGVLADVFADIAVALSSATKKAVEVATLELDIPPDPALGDFAFRCFTLAKERKEAPTAVATALASTLSATDLVARWEAAGPYLNIFLQRSVVAERVLELVRVSPSYGMGDAFAKEKVVLEYVQPNTNKPLHLGHLRNALLGWSTSALLAEQGATVVKTNIVNDRGIHIAKSMLAYERWGEGATPESTGEKGDHFVGRWYVRFEQELAKEKAAWMAQHPDTQEDVVVAELPLMKAAQELLQRWEANDDKVRALWRTMNGWVVDGFAQTYGAIGIDFAKEYFESDIFEEGRQLVIDGLAKGIFRKDDNGAIVAPLEKFGLPDKILLRGDGTALYITQDLALARRKLKDFSPTRSMYVVGSEQEMYFRQLFAVLELLGFGTVDKLVHLSYGLVFLPEGKMKSREGKVVDTDDLLREVTAMTVDELTTRYPDQPAKERERRARIIALAAIKFHFLMVGRTSPVHFNPKESLAFEGKTGPYLQYSFARASNILAKAEDPGAAPIPATIEEAEWILVLGMLHYPRVVREAAATYNPATLANALVELAQCFSGFYHDLPVLKAEGESRAFRLALTAAYRRVMKRGLALFGIETLDVM